MIETITPLLHCIDYLIIPIQKQPCINPAPTPISLLFSVSHPSIPQACPRPIQSWPVLPHINHAPGISVLLLCPRPAMPQPCPNHASVEYLVALMRNGLRFFRHNLPKPRAARRAPPQRSYIAIAGLWGTQGTGAETGSRGFGELQVQARVLGVNLCYIVYWAALVKKV